MKSNDPDAMRRPGRFMVGVSLLRRHDLPHLPVLVRADVDLAIRIFAETAGEHRADLFVVGNAEDAVAGDAAVLVLEAPDCALGVVAVEVPAAQRGDGFAAV